MTKDVVEMRKELRKQRGEELLSKMQNDIEQAQSSSNSDYQAMLRYKFEGAIEMYNAIGGEE